MLPNRSTYGTSFSSQPRQGGGQLYTQHAARDGDAEDPKTAREPRMPLTRRMVTLSGLALLTMMASIPASDAVFLLNEVNLLYWDGEFSPWLMITLLVCLVVSFYIVCESALRNQDMGHFLLHDLVLLCSTFSLLFGVVLLVSGIRLQGRVMYISNGLMYECRSGFMTSHMRQDYDKLLGLRKTAECLPKYSVEECAGFSSFADLRTTQYLKSLEESYRCTGFCSDAPVSRMTGGQNTSSSSLLAQVRSTHLSDKLSMRRDMPPTLFSNANYKATCDGMAARNLKFVVGSVAQNWWTMALVLIVSGAMMTFLEWALVGK